MDKEVVSNLIIRMCNCSVSARNYMDREEWHLSIGSDETTVELLIESLVSITNDSLFEIGVEILGTLQDICGSYNNIIHFVLLAELLLPSILYKTMRDRPEIKQMLKNIIQGSVSNQPSVIVILDSFLNGEYGEDYEAMAHYFIDKISSTSVFDIYLTNLTSLDDAIPQTSDIELARVGQFISEIAQATNAMQNILGELISKGIVTDGAGVINRMIKMFGYKLVKPENINQTSWALQLTEDVQLDDVGERLKKKIMGDIYNTVGFYPLYYKYDEGKLDKNSITLLLLWAAARNSAADTYFAASTEIKRIISTCRTFTSELDGCFNTIDKYLREKRMA